MTENLSCLLPDTVGFTHYDVELEPDFTSFTFKGAVRITCDVRRRTHAIILNSADLAIEPAGVSICYENDHGNDVVHWAASVRFDLQQEFVTFEFEREIPVGIATLDIHYTGILNDKMAGFYRSKYTGTDGTEKLLAVTQFEATDARRALPCGDEPSLKATFTSALIVPEGMTALSNTPQHWDTPLPGGKRRVQFGVTPKMSTYLLAFVVGDLEFIEAETKSGVTVRVYTVPGKSEFGRFALETGCRALEFYDEYFGIPYPLRKLDMVAIPDFAAGAMENWGLITYRENALLIDPANSSTQAYERVADVVCHEIAHQWFGNLVTMRWWTHLWLNEGFATWMSARARDTLFPTWEVWPQFLLEEYQAALILDSLRSSHPIEVPVQHPDDISQTFDDIAYAKGASIIRMIHQALGDATFRKGLKLYLTRHAYGNAVTEDLWAALSEVSGQPVEALMGSWTKQTGYPLVTIDYDTVDEENTELHSQERFLASGAELTPEESQQTWHLPTTFFNRDGLTYKHNRGQQVPARVTYPMEQWRHLPIDMEDGLLEPIDRYGLISDALALAQAGPLPTATLVELLASCRREDSYIVWLTILDALNALGSILEGTPDHARLNAFAQNLLTPIVEKLGWEKRPDDTHTTPLLRGIVLNASGAYGNAVVRQESLRLLRDNTAGITVIHPDIRLAVYKNAARVNLTLSYNLLRQGFESAGLQEEQVRFLHAMGLVRDPSLLNHVVEYGFDSGKVRNSNFIYLVSSLGSHAAGRKALWSLISTRWDDVQQRFSGGGLKMLSRVLGSALDGFTANADADLFEQFFKDHPAPSASRTIAQALEAIRTRAAWYERDGAAISGLLAQYTE